MSSNKKYHLKIDVSGINYSIRDMFINANNGTRDAEDLPYLKCIMDCMKFTSASYALLCFKYI